MTKRLRVYVVPGCLGFIRASRVIRFVLSRLLNLQLQLVLNWLMITDAVDLLVRLPNLGWQSGRLGIELLVQLLKHEVVLRVLVVHQFFQAVRHPVSVRPFRSLIRLSTFTPAVGCQDWVLRSGLRLISGWCRVRLSKALSSSLAKSGSLLSWALWWHLFVILAHSSRGFNHFRAYHTHVIIFDLGIRRLRVIRHRSFVIHHCFGFRIQRAGCILIPCSRKDLI